MQACRLHKVVPQTVDSRFCRVAKHAGTRCAAFSAARVWIPWQAVRFVSQGSTGRTYDTRRPCREQLGHGSKSICFETDLQIRHEGMKYTYPYMIAQLHDEFPFICSLRS